MANVTGSLHHCVTDPCPPTDVERLLTLPSAGFPSNPFLGAIPGIRGLPSAQGRVSGPLDFGDVAAGLRQAEAIADAVRQRFESAPPPPPAPLPPAPVASAPAEISPAENAEIDAQIAAAYESRRPVVTVGTLQELLDYERDRARIESDFPPGYVPPPELDPIVVVEDGPPVDEPVYVVDVPTLPPELIQEPPPPEEPAADLSAYAEFIESLPTDTRRPLDLGAVTGPFQPHSSESQPVEEPMDLSTILGNVGRRVLGSIDFDPSTPGIFGGAESLPDIIGAFVPPANQPGGPVAPPPVQGPPVRLEYDPSTGAVRRCAPRRRRRRLLTKSDIADISTMAALLGKNSESFKVWLAKATR